MNYIFYVVVITSSFATINTKKWILATDNDDLTTEHFRDTGNNYYLKKEPNTNKINKNALHFIMPEYLATLANNKLNVTETYDQIFQKITNVKLLENNKYLQNVTPITERIFQPSLQYISPEYDINNHKANQTRKKYSTEPKPNKRNKKYRQSKFLEVFEVVEFDHVVCISSSGLEGTCLHEFDCHSISGSPMGPCADGLGTCCVILYACDSRSAAPIGWFTNPNFPSPSSERLSCTITLDKISDDINQFRLDLTTFEILPSTSGNCEQDQFSVSGQDVNNVIPIICGINTGQHMYIEVGNTDGPINLSIQTLSEENRLFSIKVTQLTAADDLAAPTGCLQYYSDDHGHIESFNYRDRSEIGIARAPGYLNYLNYAICIGRSPSACTITYTNVGDMQIVNYDTDGSPIIPPGQAGVEIYNCPSDWLLLAAVRLCGERLNDGAVLQDFSLDAPVTDDGAGPIIVWFRSDGVYTGRGFKLHYQQNSCSSPT